MNFEEMGAAARRTEEGEEDICMMVDYSPSEVAGLPRSSSIMIGGSKISLDLPSSMSPVSHLSQTMSHLTVLPQSPILKADFLSSPRPSPSILSHKQRLAYSSARRRLSLSVDSSTTIGSPIKHSSSSPFFTITPKKSNSFCALSTSTNSDDALSHPPRVSPYRTPKRPATFFADIADEEEEEVIGGEEEEATPPKQTRLGSIQAGTHRVSPYKTPKRPAASFEEIEYDDEEDEDEEEEEEDDDEEEEEQEVALPLPTYKPTNKLTYKHTNARRLLSTSFDATALKDIKNKQLQRVSGEYAPVGAGGEMGGGGVSSLQRSTSANTFKKIPRPWGSMSDIHMSLYAKSENVSPTEKITVLPTINGAHPDLNCLATETVVDLLNGRYGDILHEHYIIDCRFPYEYEGGHIRGALNLTEQQVNERFMTKPVTDKKICIIFHCEFSSKRAPNSYRALRLLDRKANLSEYPKLHYPDIYYIHGGYKHFYEKHKEYCVGTYIEMRDENHSIQFKQCNKLRSLKRTRSLSLDCFSSFTAASASSAYEQQHQQHQHQQHQQQKALNYSSCSGLKYL